MEMPRPYIFVVVSCPCSYILHRSNVVVQRGERPLRPPPPLLFLHFPPLIFVFFFSRLHRFVTDDSFPPSNLLTAPCFSFSSSGFFPPQEKEGWPRSIGSGDRLYYTIKTRLLLLLLLPSSFSLNFLGFFFLIKRNLNYF